MWAIQAAAAPQFKVYTLAHSDILLTEVPKKSRKSAPPGTDIQGSNKTLEAIRHQGHQQASSTSRAEDPLMKDDPWKNAKFPKTVIEAAPASQAANLDARCAQMEKRLLQQLQAQTSSQGDVQMMDEDRMSAWEQRLSTLETTVQTHQQIQSQHTQEVASQVQQLHQRVDNHTASTQEIAQQVQQMNQRIDTQTMNLQQHLDATLGEHLANIERLLGQKKSRTE